MTRTFAGTIDGSPCLKITADDADTPWSTPDTDWHKFRFNSNYQELGYITKSPSNFFDNTGVVAPPNGQVTTTYYPSGSNASNCLWSREVRRTGGQRFVYYYAFWQRLGLDPNSSIYISLDNAQMTSPDYNWSYAWRRDAATYASSTDKALISGRPWPQSRSWALYNSASNTWGLTVNVTTTDTIPLLAVTPASDAEIQENSPGFTIYQLGIPLNSDPYPAVTGVPGDGNVVMRITPTMARLAKPGYNANTATPEQCIFHEEKPPLKMIKSGYFVINGGGATTTIDLGAAYSNDIFVDYQLEKIGDDMFVPPIPRGDTDNQFLVGYQISGNNLIFQNGGADQMGVRFIVFAQDSLGTSTGSAKVLENSGGRFVIRKPGTAGTRLSDIIVDSNFVTMPLVSQGYVPIASTSVNTTWPKRGTRQFVVSWSNTGFKPYVVAAIHKRYKTDSTINRFQPFYSKALQAVNYSYSVDSSFMCQLTDTDATFYMCNGEIDLYEDAYRTGGSTFVTPSAWDTIGFRYYIFAVPNSL